MHTPALQPPCALCELIAEHLRERILRHEFPPGQPLDEQALARHYAVSRTPVREALRLLCHEGLLTAHPRRGMSVAVVMADELREARELLGLLRTHDGPPADARSPLRARLVRQLEQRLRLGAATPRI